MFFANCWERPFLDLWNEMDVFIRKMIERNGGMFQCHDWLPEGEGEVHCSSQLVNNHGYRPVIYEITPASGLTNQGWYTSTRWVPWLDCRALQRIFSGHWHRDPFSGHCSVQWCWQPPCGSRLWLPEADAGSGACNCFFVRPSLRWSAARHLEPPAHLALRWPRPLRSADQPWELLMLSNVHIELEIVLHDGAAIMEHSAPHSEEAYASVLKNLPTACSLSSGLPALADAAVALRCASYQTNDAGLHGTPSVCTNYPCSCGAWRSQARCYFGWSRPSNWSLSRSTGESVPEWAVRSSGGDPLSGLAEQRRQAGLQHRQLSQLGERDMAAAGDWPIISLLS